MKNARRSTSSVTLKDWHPLSQLQQVEASTRTPFWKDTSKENFQALHLSLPSTKDSSMNLRKQVRKRKRNLPSPNPGSRQRGTELGGEESSTALSSQVPKKRSSTIGKPGRSTQITMTKNPFTVSQYSPHSLLCDKCG